MESWIGKYVVVRSSPSGCWAGTLKSIDGGTVELTNARRLWRWWAAEGVSLSGVAVAGLYKKKLGECRVAVPVENVIVREVCEVIAATDVARASIEAAEALAS